MQQKTINTKLLIIVFTALIFGLLTSLFIEQLSHIKIDTTIGGGSFQYFVGLMWALVIWLFILFLPIPRDERRVLSWLWFLRCLVTLGFMIFYESVYSLDASLYYRDAIYGQYQFSWSDFHGTSSVTALVAFFNNFFPVFNSYHAIKVLFSLLGLIGAWAFYKAFTLHFKRNIRLLWLLGAFPSALFWSSILGKDPLTFLGLGIFAYGIARLYKDSNLRSILIMLAGAVFLSMIRFWLPLIFSIPIVLTYLFKKSEGSRPFAKWLSAGGFLVFFYFAFRFFAQMVNFTNMLDAYERVNMMSRSWSSGGSSLAVPTFSSWVDVVLFVPQGAFAALFRPLPGEINNPFGIISGLENLFLLIFLIRFVYLKSRTLFSTAYISYLILTVLIWSFIYAFFSYQNLGTAVRFKLQIMPYLIALIYLGFQKDEIKNENPT